MEGGRGEKWVGSPGPTQPITCSSCCGICCSCPGQSGTLGRWRRKRRSGCLRPSTPTQGKGKNAAPQESLAVHAPWEHTAPWPSQALTSNDENPPPSLPPCYPSGSLDGISRESGHEAGTAVEEAEGDAVPMGRAGRQRQARSARGC